MQGNSLNSGIFQPDRSVYSKARAAGKTGVLPLSWHLRKDDKDLIEEAWKCEYENNDNCKRVLEFVGRPQGQTLLASKRILTYAKGLAIAAERLRTPVKGSALRT